MKEKPFDVHCHLEQKNYDEDREQLIKDLKTKLSGVITCSAHPKDFEFSLKLAEKHKSFIYVMAGIHPIYIDKFSDKQINEFIKKLEKNIDKVVAIGEIGLDYYWIKDEKLKNKQKELFIKFIKLAKKLKKALVIHSRDAGIDTFKILEKYAEGMKILLHCYSYYQTPYISKVIKNNWIVSIGPGILRSKSARKAAKKLPLKNIMLETDSPWFPIKPQKRGTPENVYKVAEKIAEEKKISQEEVIRETNKNVKRFFGIK